MSKPMLFMSIIFFITVVVILANSLEVTSMQHVGAAPNMPDTIGIGTIGDFIKTLFRIMTFNLEGVPTLVNAFLFTPITFGLGYMFVDLIWIG